MKVLSRSPLGLFQLWVGAATLLMVAVAAARAYAICLCSGKRVGGKIVLNDFCLNLSFSVKF